MVREIKRFIFYGQLKLILSVEICHTIVLNVNEMNKRYSMQDCKVN